MPDIQDLLKEYKPQVTDYKKLCFEKAKKEWKGKCPFPIYWGTHTSHLKGNDWHYMWSISNDGERRGSIWSKVFWGSLKVKI